MKYKNPLIEPSEERVINHYGGYQEYRRQHPEYHLYADLQESLPRLNRLVSKLSKINLPPLNDRGLPF